LQGGQGVRLRQGKAEDSTVYHENPVEMARNWKELGAEYLHLVDLDGAFEGKPVHTQVIRDITTSVGIPVEIGGGIRTDEHAAELIEAGVDRVIIGTRALEDLDGLADLVKRFGRHIAVGIDARDGWVQVRGWTVTTERDAAELSADVVALGVETIIYTDTARDGMLGGVNHSAMDRICEAASCEVIASGGVSTVGDIERLKELGRSNLTGAIVGKALYEKTVTLPELIQAANS
jgi:phosphoribosylformimino-5-aminoimidazole carboxamide ribotide isomerase